MKLYLIILGSALVGITTILLFRSHSFFSKSVEINEKGVTKNSMKMHDIIFASETANSLSIVPHSIETSNESELSRISREQKVASSLQRFIERTAHITPELVAKEQQRIALGLEHALNRETVEPRIDKEKDASGITWKILDYGDGVIRYDLIDQNL